jgi:hypothetical protein
MKTLRKNSIGWQPVVFRLGLIASVILLAGPGLASSWQFVGARHQAMGGAGVGFVDDSSASYWNPANLGFDKGWDVQLPITLNASIENQALEKLSGMVVGFEGLGQEVQNIFSCAPDCPVGPIDVLGQGQAANLLARFAEYGQAGESAHLGIDIGLAGRYNNFGFSIISQTVGTVFPNTDLGNVGLGIAVADFIGSGNLVPREPSSMLRDDIVAAGVGGMDPWCP